SLLGRGANHHGPPILPRPAGAAGTLFPAPHRPGAVMESAGGQTASGASWRAFARPRGGRGGERKFEEGYERGRTGRGRHPAGGGAGWMLVTWPPGAAGADPGHSAV